MGAALPKQYLEVAGRRVIEHTLARLCAHPRIAGVMVVLGADDPWWARVSVPPVDRLLTTPGGGERCHSVLNGLRALAAVAAPGDWVLVHDAARPCVRRTDLDRLMDTLADHPVGGLLGLPVRDTMKRADDTGGVTETVSRAALWHAQTPQMFRLAALRAALEAATGGGRLVTDEAEAMELAGFAPRMVEGSPDNIKVTHPEDLALAALFLQAQEAE